MIPHAASHPEPAQLTHSHILVVDDEPMVTTSITTMLNLELDCNAVGYNSPVEALKALESGPMPDVVISDFLMPDMDGLTFLQHVRARYPETTLILLTGYADKENAIEAINNVGIYRYLEKPWDNEALKMAIRNGVERTHLMASLRDKIAELEQAKTDLHAYSEHLEERVTEKTLDLTLTLNKLKAVVEHTDDAIATVEADGTIQRVNPSFARWAKTSGEKLTGKPITHYLSLNTPEVLSQCFEPDAESRLCEGVLGQIAVEVNLSPLPGGMGVVLVCRDIVQRKEAERLREDFVSTLTHDLRTPLLASIQTLGFFLDLDGPLRVESEEQRNMLLMMRDSHQQMLALVNALLDVYRYEAKQQKLLIAPLRLKEMVTQVLGELHALAQNKKQTMSHTLGDDLPLVHGDSQAIRRVLTNLVGNALHYTPAGGQISVHATCDEEALTLTVKDNGRGIPAKDLPHLFERFAQGTSRHRTTGTGLGLYLSRQILEAHGGKIWAESTENVGSQFMIQLPLLARRD